jgi:hypothetical protein
MGKARGVSGPSLLVVLLVLAGVGKCVGVCGNPSSSAPAVPATMASAPKAPAAPVETVAPERTVDPTVLAHRERVERYAAMKPAQRSAEVPKLCPPSAVLPRRTVQQILDDYVPCEDEDGVTALLEAVSSTPEATKLKAAVGAAKKKGASMHRAATRSALCCDGTASDSCMCADIHQGCCSHHGGVCGCE